jgi:hypothetical protein
MLLKVEPDVTGSVAIDAAAMRPKAVKVGTVFTS